MGNPPYAVNSS